MEYAIEEKKDKTILRVSDSVPLFFRMNDDRDYRIRASLKYHLPKGMRLSFWIPLSIPSERIFRKELRKGKMGKSLSENRSDGRK